MNPRHTDSPNTVSQTLSPSPPLHSFHYQQTINTQQSWREAERTISAWKGLMLIPNTLRTSSKSKKNSHTIVLKDSDVSGSSVLNIDASGDSRATTISSEAGPWRILQELHHSLSLEPSSRSDEMIPAYHPAKQSKPRINARMEMHDGSKRLTKKVWLGKSHGEPPCRASKATRQGNLGMIAAQYAIDSLSSRSGALIGFPRVSRQRSNPQKCQQGWMKFRSHSKQCDIQTKRLRFTPLCARTVLSC